MKKALFVFAITSFTVGSAFAQATFEAVDADASNSITLEEANAAGLPWTAEEFAAADKDGDGALNAEEFAATQ